MAYLITAIKDPYFTGENEAYSRGYMAAYRRTDAAKWTPCADWIADGHGSGHNATVWRDTPEAAKEAAKKWLKKKLARRK